MKKILFLSVLALVLVSALVSAETLIGGRIYDASNNQSIANANVTVSCTHNSEVNLMSTLSNLQGKYNVVYQAEDCSQGDALQVSAVKNELSGSTSGTVNGEIGFWDVAVVDVPLIPEFGVVVGIITVIGALSVFFVVRRK